MEELKWVSLNENDLSLEEKMGMIVGKFSKFKPYEKKVNVVCL